VFSGLAQHTALLLIVGLYFQSLTNSTCLAAVLHVPLVSLEAPKFFVATQTSGETSGPLEQQLPEREWAALSRKEFCFGISKKEEL
jgi:hypothetical protein